MRLFRDDLKPVKCASFDKPISCKNNLLLSESRFSEIKSPAKSDTPSSQQSSSLGSSEASDDVNSLSSFENPVSQKLISKASNLIKKVSSNNQVAASSDESGKQTPLVRYVLSGLLDESGTISSNCSDHVTLNQECQQNMIEE